MRAVFFLLAADEAETVDVHAVLKRRHSAQGLSATPFAGRPVSSHDWQWCRHRRILCHAVPAIRAYKVFFLSLLAIFRVAVGRIVVALESSSSSSSSSGAKRVDGDVQQTGKQQQCEPARCGHEQERHEQNTVQRATAQPKGTERGRILKMTTDTDLWPHLIPKC